MSKDNDFTAYSGDEPHIAPDSARPKKVPFGKRVSRNFKDPGTRRILLVAGSAIVILGGVFAWNLFNVIDPNRVELVADKKKIDNISRGANVLATPAMQEQAAVADAIRVDNAMADNGSAAVSLPNEVYRQAQEADASDESGLESPPTYGSEPSPSPINRTAGEEVEGSGPVTLSSKDGKGGSGSPLPDKVLLDRVNAQLAKFSEAWKEVDTVSELRGTYDPTISAAALEPFDPDAAGASSQDDEGRLVARAGTMFYGVNRIAATSALPGSPIVFDINTGELNGHTLIGSFGANDRCMQVNLTSISGPKYRQPIQAVMIDPATNDSCVYDLVEPHLIERYGLRFATAIIGGFASAKASAASTVVTSALGSVTETRDSQTEDQAIWSGVESLAEAAQDEVDQVIEDRFGQPEVSIYANAPYAVILLSDLVEDQS